MWGLVLLASISASHVAIAFSLLDTIDPPFDFVVKSPIVSRDSCLYATRTDQEDLVTRLPLTEKSADDYVDTACAGIASYHRKRRITTSASENFDKRFHELLEFKETHGHTRVPRRHGKLGDWVNKLRQRKHQLDEQRLDRLNQIGFCWDASDDKRRKEREKWWNRLESLRRLQQDNPLTIAEAGTQNDAPADASLSVGISHQQSATLSFDCLQDSEKKWLRRQRIQYIDSGRKPSLKLDEKQIQALNEIDPNWWQTTRERKWYAQYSALKEFRAKHGHSNVTSAHEDKKLFNWVQNTRKKYRALKLQREDGFRSDGSPKLTTAQIELLDSIDFIWDPWGHYEDRSWLSYTTGSDNKLTSL